MSPEQPTLRTPRRLAVMQPYLFPYIGYFALAATVDCFVFYDDVAFIRNGWINRNRWLLDGRPAYFTIPLRNASSFRPICDVHIERRTPWRRKLLSAMHQHYRRAPHFDVVAPMVEAVLGADDDRIAEIAKSSVRESLRYLQLDTRFVDSSSAYGNQDLRGEARVLDICRQEAATEYVNLGGGRGLYDPDAFAGYGMALRFIDKIDIRYPQSTSDFVPNLSIIDVLMRNDRDVVRQFLTG